MSAPVDFYFDFASPYGYIASEQVDALVGRHGRTAVWHAIVFDASFQAQDRIRISAAVMRSNYVQRDAVRTAAYFGVPFKPPSQQGLHTELAARAFHWLSDRNPEQARVWAHAVFRAYFVDDRNIATLEVLLELAGAAGIDAGELGAALGDGASRQRLNAEIDMAEARGVFASPFFIVEGERFWDTTRMPQLERWLERGPY
ncbi:MAG TPA: 2-hydroxychromene-2-carboxylate isomerase [Rubrivivax sp.]